MNYNSSIKKIDNSSEIMRVAWIEKKKLEYGLIPI